MYTQENVYFVFLKPWAIFLIKWCFYELLAALQFILLSGEVIYHNLGLPPQFGDHQMIWNTTPTDLLRLMIRLPPECCGGYQAGEGCSGSTSTSL